MLPRPPEQDQEPWRTSSESYPPNHRGSLPSFPPLIHQHPTILNGIHNHNDYVSPFGESAVPQQVSNDLVPPNVGSLHFSPDSPSPSLSLTNDLHHDSHQRPNGLAMLPNQTLGQMPESRGSWTSHDRRKSFRISSEGFMEEAGNVDWHGAHGSQEERRSSWVNGPLSPPDHRYVQSPLGSGEFLPLPARASPLVGSSSATTFANALSGLTNLASPSPYLNQNQIQFQHPFPPPLASCSSYPPFPSQPPPASSHDFSLPFRDFTAHHSHPPCDNFLPSPPQPSHLAAASVPLSAYLPSHSQPPRLNDSTKHRRSSTAPPLSANPSSPYIPSSDPSKPSSAVLKAAAHRQSLGVLDVTGRKSVDARQARRSVVQPSVRRAVELEFSCDQCGQAIGKLSLRGGVVDMEGGNDTQGYLGRFFCGRCMPIPAQSSNGKEREISYTGYNDEALYADTLSGAVDRFQGIDLDQVDTRPPPAAPGKGRTGFVPLDAAPVGKKRRASVLEVTATTEGVLGCDVCRREIASGSMSLLNGEPVNAAIEVLCAHCDTRYLRCSDCGGGGGTKGVGRWRCKELFPLGRRTCQLLHTRLGLVNEMIYDVWTIAELSTSQRDEISGLCADLYNTTLLGTLAVPDMIESTAPIARSFEEVEKACIDSWTTYDPLIREDVELSSPSATKRYLALRWSKPTIRKKKSRAKNAASSTSSGAKSRGPKSPPPTPPSNTDEVPTLIREGKTLSGFILAEHDLEWGIVHLALVLPTGAGEAYDATTRLQQTLIARITTDLASTNAHRAANGQKAYPSLTQAWTMHMTKRDSRIMSRVETRRGFIPLDDYFAKNPEANRDHFAPRRTSYLPPELLRGWLVYAKRITSDDFPPGHCTTSIPHQQQPPLYHQAAYQYRPSQPPHPLDQHYY